MISNSSPVIFLAKINQLNLLKELFNIVKITSKVKEEVLVKDKPGYFALAEAIKRKWINIEDPKREIDFGLDKGENSALNLAKELKDTLITDDLIATKIAKEIKIKTIRTTTLIFMAYHKSLMTKDETIALFKKLVDSGYYISPQYYTTLLNKLIIEKRETKISDLVEILDKKGYKEKKNKRG